jgi:hypothetical protein
VFSAAIELPVEERVPFGRQRCGADTVAAGRIEELLGLHRMVDDLDQSLNKWLGEELAHSSPPFDLEDLVGERLGPYLVEERIGEGGTGVVYWARQEEPLRREVAIKGVKPGMDTKEVLTRFAAERQTLAVMLYQGEARAALPVIRQTFDYSLETNGGVNINTVYMGSELMRALLLNGDAVASSEVGLPLMQKQRAQFSDRHILALFEIRLGLALYRTERTDEAGALIIHAGEIIESRKQFIPPTDREQFAR